MRQLLYAAALLDQDQEPVLTRANRTSRAVDSEQQDPSPAGSGAPGGKMTDSVRCQQSGVVSAATGLAALHLYVQSSTRYGHGTGAFLLPCYGTAELPQVRIQYDCYYPCAIYVVYSVPL